ncbi:MAG: sugar ABC transporter ATP-binding protein [Eubacteriales bacterium]|nr:sugar ABC transporter ATP-binding protein [Christensenellaceae bacterium]MEA5066525.1 sugar ABC transporter ATP-binding protein [Eubacteriales bacterium]
MKHDPSEIILSVENVSKAFPGVKALSDVSICVRRGDVHGIVGENGAGKSTLMKILSGVYEKDAGTVVFEGESVDFTTPIQSIRRGLSIIYQEFNLVNSMSVGENIFLGRFHEVGGMKGTHRRARALLDSIGSTIDTRRLVSELSCSEKQMVEITKALSYNSKLIIMDEPSSSLTEEELSRLGAIIRTLRDQGISIIYISHKLDEIFEYCDRVTVMRDGRVIDTRDTRGLGRAELIAMMVGRPIESEYPERPRCVGDAILTVRNLNTRKLHDISFTLRRGEILGLVGLVGAGRTEIVRALFGADKVRGHEVTLNGRSVRIRGPVDAKRLGIGFVPEDRKLQGLVLPFSVRSNISMASLGKIGPRGVLRMARERTIADRHIASLAIKTPSQLTRVESLSGGNQQKCVLGRWLETEPNILILDEPTRGIDVGAKYEIYLLMKRIAEGGGAILLISSELPEVLGMSNRVLTVTGGRITGEFDPERATAQEIMSRAIG